MNCLTYWATESVICFVFFATDFLRMALPSHSALLCLCSLSAHDKGKDTVPFNVVGCTQFLEGWRPFSPSANSNLKERLFGTGFLLCWKHSCKKKKSKRDTKHPFVLLQSWEHDELLEEYIENSCPSLQVKQDCH